MSRIETIPNETLAQIFQIISELPQTVLVKMDRRKLARNLTVPDNVYTMDWIPQYKTLCELINALFRSKFNFTIILNHFDTIEIPTKE